MFLEKLDFLMNERSINKSILAKKSGIPYTTIDGFYKKGNDNAKLSTLKKLLEYFNASLDFLMRDSNILSPKEIKRALALNTKETQLITRYRELSEEGQEKANDYVNDLADTGKYKKHGKYAMDIEKKA